MGSGGLASGRRAATILLLPLSAIVFVGYVLPGLVLLAMEFRYCGGKARRGSQFFLEHYERFLGDVYYARIIGYTLLFGLIVATITAIIAFPVGYYLARSRSRSRPVFTQS